MKEILDGLSSAEKRVLLALKELKVAAPEQILSTGKFASIEEVMSASSWLKAKGFVEFDERVTRIYSLGAEGRDYVKRKLPERRVLEILMQLGEASIDDGRVKAVITPQEKGIAIKWLKEKMWAMILPPKEGSSGITLKITPVGSKSDSQGLDEAILEKLSGGEAPEEELSADGIAMLKKRQNVVTVREAIERKIKLSAKGAELLAHEITVKEELSEITHDIIRTGRWKDADIRKYDIHAPVASAHAAKAHPINQMIGSIRQIFLEMGFTEIEYDYVVSCFWDMDILFIPQDHPAREMQDTFYMDAKLPLPNDAMVKKIANVHENGGKTGSTGWGYKWNRADAEKTVLRTHTTVNTIRYLVENPQSPARVFSIGKVFRREAIDATHLPEFYQIEGIIMEEHANFNMLVGILREFYKKMGFENVRFRPGFFPYTEPSLEVEVFFNNKWMELGGAGIFRPEVTQPIGLKHRVLAWGLGLERLAMLKLGIKDIRDLYISDIEWLKKSPMVD